MDEKLRDFFLSDIQHDDYENVSGGIWAAISICGQNPKKFSPETIARALITKSGDCVVNWILPKYMNNPDITALIRQAKDQLTDNFNTYHGPMPEIKIAVQGGMITGVYGTARIPVEIIDLDSTDPKEVGAAAKRLEDVITNPSLYELT